MKFWSKHHSFHWWSRKLRGMLENIFAFLTLFSIGKTFIFAAICWKSSPCFSPSLHNQISPLKFTASSPRREEGAAWTQSYGFLLVLKECAEKMPPCEEDSFGSISVVCWSNIPGAEATLLTFCKSWGSWQTRIWENAVPSPGVWQPDSSVLLVLPPPASSQPSSSQISLTILTLYLFPLYSFTVIPLTTHTHSPWHI